jgi:hypothetical protein
VERHGPMGGRQRCHDDEGELQTKGARPLGSVRGGEVGHGGPKRAAC